MNEYTEWIYRMNEYTKYTEWMNESWTNISISIEIISYFIDILKSPIFWLEGDKAASHTKICYSKISNVLLISDILTPPWGGVKTPPGERRHTPNSVYCFHYLMCFYCKFDIPLFLIPRNKSAFEWESLYRLLYMLYLNHSKSLNMNEITKK